MGSFKGKYALITGASSGIGYEFVKLFAEDGSNLIIISRNEKRLLDIKREIENEHKVNVLVLAKDLSKREAPKEICNQLENENIPVDILVNNAGVGYHGPRGRYLSRFRLDRGGHAGRAGWRCEQAASRRGEGKAHPGQPSRSACRNGAAAFRGTCRQGDTDGGAGAAAGAGAFPHRDFPQGESPCQHVCGEPVAA